MIKNKRLKTDVEKYELELFWRGEFSIDENEEPKEDASAAPAQGELASIHIELGAFGLLFFLFFHCLWATHFVHFFNRSKKY